MQTTLTVKPPTVNNALRTDVMSLVFLFLQSYSLLPLSPPPFFPEKKHYLAIPS